MKANVARLRIALLLSLGLAGCVKPPQPAPVPRPAPVVTPRPAPAPPTPPPANWLNRPATPGAWSWRQEGGQSLASFAGNGAVVFALACDPARRTITLRGNPVGSNTPLVVTTTSTRRALSGEPSLAAGDPLLDAMAFSRGRFMVEGAGSGPLYLSSAPELSRAIEDCR